MPVMVAPLSPALARALDGDRGAWRELHRELHPVARGFLRFMGVRPDEMDDACQEVFLRVFRYLPRWERRADIKTWLYRVCLSEASRVHRRHKRRALLAALLGRRPAGSVVPGSGSGPAGEDEDRRLVGALGHLPRPSREVLVLFELQGLSGAEIAHVLGCPVATVWRRLHYARKELAALVEGGLP